MKVEEWSPIKDFRGLYEVNVKGDVRSLHKRNYQKLLTPNIDKHGYYHVKLSKGGKQTTKHVHRIVAETFIANPDSKGYVNHIDADKLNNCVTNLEWCTHSENIRHAFKLGLISRKKIPVLDKCTGQVFPSAKEAAAHYGVNYFTMRNYLTGNIKTNPTCAEYVREAA